MNTYRWDILWHEPGIRLKWRIAWRWARNGIRPLIGVNDKFLADAKRLLTVRDSTPPN